VWVSWFAALLAGLVTGAVAKLWDEFGISWAGAIGTDFGVWIVLVALIAAWSRTWSRAVLCAVTFLLGMVAAYYVSQMLLFGFFSTYLFLAWATVALFLAPLFAALVWQARNMGWLAALGAAVPIGLLLSEAYSLRWQLLLYGAHPAQLVFDIVAAMALLVILPRNGAQRVRVLALTPVIVLGAPIILNHVWAAVGRFM
jgi:hypothetical protein